MRHFDPKIQIARNDYFEAQFALFKNTPIIYVAALFSFFVKANLRIGASIYGSKILGSLIKCRSLYSNKRHFQFKIKEKGCLGGQDNE